MADRVLEVWDYMKGLPLYAKIATGGIVVGVIAVVVIKKARAKPRRKEYPRNTVILHQIGRGPHAPSLSPFCLKLETYLRMAKVPYQNDHDFQRSLKGKFPWIEYNGEAVADSSFSIKFINKTFGIDVNKGLSGEEKACAHAWQKVLEEHTFWAALLHRWIYDKEATAISYLPIPKYVFFLSRRYIRKCAYGHGIGRHSQEEVYQLLDEDLGALSSFLGDKKFIVGDNPCEEDAAIFGLLAEFYWESFGDRTEKTFKKYKNLCNYCERMKQKFWPDWDDCITHNNTRVPTA